MPGKNAQTPEEHQSGLSLIARLFWMLFGNAILCILIVSILLREGRMFHTLDLVFWITVAALAFARYLDIKLWSGLTATGLPATMVHWTKYVTLLLICSTALWLLSHAVNYLVINR